MYLSEVFKKKNLERRDKVYFIAEIGVNHEGSIKSAKKLITQAKLAGANAVKFQTYKAEKIASKYAKAYWDLKEEPTKNQYDLFKKYDSFSEKQYRLLSNYCKKISIDFMSTPFDIQSAEFLNKYVSSFKISSSDITNYPLLEKISKFNKPVILSTGASNINEIKRAEKLFKNKKLILLHCILNYPTQDRNVNLGMMLDLKKKFPKRVIGYSDHSIPIDTTVLETAVLLGAKVIEKHFTLNKKLKGNDHYHAYNLKDFRILKKKLERLTLIIGGYEKKYLKSEVLSRKHARRSLYANNELKKGNKIKKSDIISLRPAIGLCPTKYRKIIGKKLIKDISKGELIQISNFKK